MPVPLSVLKPFIRQAIASAAVIAYDSREPYETLMKRAAQKAEDSHPGSRISPRLSVEMAQWYRELAQKSMDAIAVMEGHPPLTDEQFARAFERMDRLSPSTALSVIYQSLLPLRILQP